MGVTGGTPLGFDVGARGAGGTLRGLDLGVRGMRVGGCAPSWAPSRPCSFSACSFGHGAEHLTRCGKVACLQRPAAGCVAPCLCVDSPLKSLNEGWAVTASSASATLIVGWRPPTHPLVPVQVGGRRKLIVPPNLAYGDKASGGAMILVKGLPYCLKG